MNFLRFAIFAIMALLFAACSTTKQAPQLTRYEQHMNHDILDMKSVQNSENILFRCRKRYRSKIHGFVPSYVRFIS